MSIQYMDNFSIYGDSETNLSAGTPWFNMSIGTSAIVDDPDILAPATSKVFRVSNTTSFQPSFAVPSPTDEPRVAFRLWLDGLDPTSGGNTAWYWSDTSGNIQYVLHVGPSGSLRLMHVDGADGTRMDSFSYPTVFETGPVITTSAWQHIEVYLNFTTGAYELWLEGLSLASGTDAEGAVGGTCGIFQFRANGFAGESTPSDLPLIKDFIFADSSGSVNNGQIGTGRVTTITPDGDVSGTWTSTETNAFSAVNELDPDDSDFITAEDSPLPVEQVFSLTNLPPDVVTVRAIQPMARMNKANGGDASIVMSLKSGSQEDQSTTKNPLTSPSYLWFISELDPETGSAWTPTSVDNANLGVDRTL